MAEQALLGRSTGRSHFPIGAARRAGQVALTPLYLLYEKRLLSQVRRCPVPRHVGLVLDGLPADVLEQVVVEGFVGHAPNLFSSRTATALGTNAETSPP